MDSNKNALRAVDFFCGAGGWSEGFRQYGIKVVQGIDNWAPAVKTHNLNHGLQDEPVDILIFEKCKPDFIDENIPDTEIIVGSPPCVSFSMSNNAGKADKSLGIRLIETYLRIVAYKKHKKNSKLKIWYMENVPNSKNYVKQEYTFADLGLKSFSESIGKKPNGIALRASHDENGGILCAADYGSPQKRERFVCGEILFGPNKGKFLAPKKTHDKHIALADIKEKLPPPNSEFSNKLCVDPNYPNLELPLFQITDHFYDTGVYEIEWQAAKRAKIDHPFMGKMAFPEDENRPSRTIMATRSASTREAILYKSETRRTGDGEYRIPTIREASSLMGFPITYQYFGSESVKWRQIGNAVCPHMSAAIAREIRSAFDLPKLKNPIFETIENLNDFQIKELNSPPGKKSDSKYRRHPFKTGNMTVALINFNPHDKIITPGKKWYACAFVGSGKAYKPIVIDEDSFKRISKLIESETDGKKFSEEFKKAFTDKIANHEQLQKMHVEHKDYGPFLKPDGLIEAIKEFISKQIDDKTTTEHDEMEKIIGRKKIPKRQLYAMFAIGFVTSKKTN